MEAPEIQSDGKGKPNTIAHWIGIVFKSAYSNYRFLGLMCLAIFVRHVAFAAPTVSNVQAAQRPGTQLVDIHYELADATNSTMTVGVMVSTDGGANYSVSALSVGGDIGGGISPGTNKVMTWNAGVDWPQQYSTNVRFRIIADDQPQTNSAILLIGRDGSSANYRLYITKQGTSFTLVWTNNLDPNQFPNCQTFVIGPSGNNCKGIWPDWDSADVTTDGELDLSTSTNLATGTYTFGIICMGDPSQPNPPLPVSVRVTLEVISTSIGEF